MSAVLHSGGRFVGQPVRRREDRRMLGGASRFLDDIERPRLAHVAVVRSPHAHARIEEIAVPEHAAGLRGVFTAADFGTRVKPFPLLPLEGARLAEEPHPVLAGDEVRYVGQPVAIVVADSRALAEDAAELVEVGYEALPAIVDPRRSDLDLLRWSGGGGDVEGRLRARRTSFAAITRYRAWSPPRSSRAAA